MGLRSLPFFVVVAVLLGAPPPARAVTIDFQTLPDGTPTSEFLNVETAYASLGVVFVADDPSDPSSGVIRSTVAPTFFLTDFNRAIGGSDIFNLIAVFSVPVTFISVNGWAAANRAMTMTAFDATGAVLGSTTQGAASTNKGILSLSGIGTIASVRWVTSDPTLSTPGIDDLIFIPEPSVSLLSVMVLAALGHHPALRAAASIRNREGGPRRGLCHPDQCSNP